MSALNTLLADHPLPGWRGAAWPVMGLLLIFAVWVGFAELDEVAVAAGEVVPRGKIKVIQHLEGGIVEQIFVEEGSLVTVGKPLIQLNLATSGVNRNEILARLNGELLRRARLQADVSGQALRLPEDIAAAHPDLATAERDALAAQQAEIASTLAVLNAQLRQRRHEVQELEARRRATASNLAFAQERQKMSDSLLADGLTPKMEHLQLRAEVEKLNGELRGLHEGVPRAQAAVSEAEKRLAEGEFRFRRQAQDELEQAEHSIARLKETLAQATDQTQRAEIHSPIEGIVKRLRYHTIGGVVGPGEPIMEIVPTDDRLVVRARLNPIDRGYVHLGQPALVKVTTYDYIRYGGLEGEVVQVAPDSLTDDQGRAYFEVVVETEKTHLGLPSDMLAISPGMQAMVDIHTGKKSVLEYVLTPVLKLRHEAFRER